MVVHEPIEYGTDVIHRVCHVCGVNWPCPTEVAVRDGAASTTNALAVLKAHHLMLHEEDEPECSCGEWLPQMHGREFEEHDGHVAAALEAALPHLALQPVVDREAISAALEEHGVLLFEPQPQCRCGHVYEDLHLGGVSWKVQSLHRADAVLALLNGTAK